jgi:hypothetical protein
MPQPPRLEEQIRGAIRLKHYSRKTEEAYVGWYKQFDSALPTGLTPNGAA